MSYSAVLTFCAVFVSSWLYNIKAFATHKAQDVFCVSVNDNLSPTVVLKPAITVDSIKFYKVNLLIVIRLIWCAL